MENNEKKLYEEILNTWIDENETEEITNERFKKLDKKAEILYEFVIAYNSYMNTKKDYGTGEELSMIEAHILLDIVDNKGITVTELSKKWRKTKSAISQTIKSLLKKEYIYRENSQTDAKIFYLLPKEKAFKFVLAHKKYDNIDIIKTNKLLLKKFSIEELGTFYKVLEEYTNILNKKK
ncbi:MarR family transcriptional regulator [Fusobacterium sp. FSA-380-WT-3A]|nr:MarR family transcriptional regulator [Fusobacterium sp. FSA-380-WT-3A]